MQEVGYVLLHVFLCLYKEYQCRGFSEQQSTQILSGTRTTHTNSQFTIPLAERERERERFVRTAIDTNSQFTFPLAERKRERERERGMDALNSTKPDDHQVVSPTRVLLHLAIISINIGFTLSS